MHVTQLLLPLSLPLSWSGQPLFLLQKIIELEAQLRETEDELFCVRAQLALINDNLNGNN